MSVGTGDCAKAQYRALKDIIVDESASSCTGQDELIRYPLGNGHWYNTNRASEARIYSHAYRGTQWTKHKLTWKSRGKRG